MTTDMPRITTTIKREFLREIVGEWEYRVSQSDTLGEIDWRRSRADESS